MDAIALIGGGGHARVVLSILNKLNRYRVIGYTDGKNTGALSGINHLGNDESLAAVAAENDPLNVALAVGQTGLGTQRWKLWSRLTGVRLFFPSVISPDAVVNEGVTVSEAVVVMDGTVINCGAVVGRGCDNKYQQHD